MLSNFNLIEQTSFIVILLLLLVRLIYIQHLIMDLQDRIYKYKIDYELPKSFIKLLTGDIKNVFELFFEPKILFKEKDLFKTVTIFIKYYNIKLNSED